MSIHSISTARLGGSTLMASALFLVSLVAGCDWLSIADPSPPESMAPTEEATQQPPTPRADSREVTIAKCLTAEGVKLYGSKNCPATQSQIRSFKDGFKYLRYVECTERPALCNDKDIWAYPTWIIQGEQLVGYHEPQYLSTYAGCSR